MNKHTGRLFCGANQLEHEESPSHSSRFWPLRTVKWKFRQFRVRGGFAFCVHTQNARRSIWFHERLFVSTATTFEMFAFRFAFVELENFSDFFW